MNSPMDNLIKELLVVAANHDARAKTGELGFFDAQFLKETAKAVAIRDALFAALAELDALEDARLYLDSLEAHGAEDGFLEQYHKLFSI